MIRYPIVPALFLALAVGMTGCGGNDGSSMDAGDAATTGTTAPAEGQGSDSIQVRSSDWKE